MVSVLLGWLSWDANFWDCEMVFDDADGKKYNVTDCSQVEDWIGPIIGLMIYIFTCAILGIPYFIIMIVALCRIAGLINKLK